LPASASPAGYYLATTSLFCKPPLGEGWGIFDRHNGEFSAGVDKLTNSTVPFTHITGATGPGRGFSRRQGAAKLLKGNGAGDGTRTRDVQLGKLNVD